MGEQVYSPSELTDLNGIANSIARTATTASTAAVITNIFFPFLCDISNTSRKPNPNSTVTLYTDKKKEMLQKSSLCLHK